MTLPRDMEMIGQIGGGKAWSLVWENNETSQNGTEKKGQDILIYVSIFIERLMGVIMLVL